MKITSIPEARISIFLVGIFIAAALGCNGRVVETNGYPAATEWKSLSPGERSTFVEGYADGYALGSSAACNNADLLFEAKPPWFDKDGNPNNPVTRCQAALDHFSRMGKPGERRANYTMYEFYEKYP